MEKAINNNGRNVVLRLPPGFRFHPTDEELIMQYLKRKVYSFPLPVAIIPDIDLAKFDPWDILGGCEEERYVFNLREGRYRNGNRINRAGRSGYWKATGKEKGIVCSRSKEVIGVKKVLVFYRGKPSIARRTDYIMHEYQLATSFLQRNNSLHNSIVPSGDWVLCRLFKKRRGPKIEEEIEEGQVEDRERIQFIDFMGQQSRYRNSSAAMPESSCVTELFDESNCEEETSPAI